MAEHENLLLIAVGPDHVGLVQKISEYIAERGCNIEDSRMAVLRGEFALILLLSGDKASLERIAEGREHLATTTGLNILVKQPAGKRPGEAALPYKLVASSMDHPGIVHKISTTLSRAGINIESMETESYSAPETGTPIFRIEAILSIPANVNIHSVRGRFAEIEKEENIDIELSLIPGRSRKP